MDAIKTNATTGGWQSAIDSAIDALIDGQTKAAPKDTAQDYQSLVDALQSATDALLATNDNTTPTTD